MSTVDTGQARAVDDLPRLAVDRVQMQTWAREITMIVEALERWRLRRDRVAEDAARRHDDQERSARPPVARPLTEREAAAWRGGAADDARTETRFDVRTGRGLRVRFGPVESGQWVLDAQVDQVPAPAGGEAGGPFGLVTVEQVAVSCRTEQDARALAEELLGAGPDVEKLRTLRQRAAQRAARQAAAAGRVRETDPQLLERVRDEVGRHWRPELAERVISSPAFGRFARGLGELESRGATIDDVLRRQGLQDKLARPLVRDPAAFGASLFASLLTTIDGEVVSGPDSSRDTGEQARRRPSPTPRGDGQARAAGLPPGGGSPQERAWLRSITEDTVWPALTAALGEPVARQVRAAGGYERLAQELAARHAVGWSLDALLTGLPAERIITAGDPAGYLRGIIARRVEQRGAEQRAARRPADRERIDQHAMARVVGEVFPDAIARRLLECPAWPALCTQMTQAQPRTADDPPVAALLARLPERSIGRARKPAAYAAELLRRELAVRRGADPAAEVAAEDAHLGRGPDGVAGLDSASALDRVALDDLGPSASQAMVAAGVEAEVEVGVAAHRHASVQQSSIAADLERDAAMERGAPDTVEDPAVDAEPAITAQDQGADAGADGGIDPGHARVDDNLAAAARANAAREMGSGAAAALRAQVVNTPHDASRPSSPVRSAGAAAVKSAPKVMLQRGRRR